MHVVVRRAGNEQGVPHTYPIAVPAWCRVVSQRPSPLELIDRVGVWLVVVELSGESCRYMLCDWLCSEPNRVVPSSRRLRLVPLPLRVRRRNGRKGKYDPVAKRHSWASMRMRESHPPEWEDVGDLP